MAKNIKKVPVILQMENVECGAACLAMILAYNKRYVPLEQLRSDCSVSRDGSNAKNIIIAAQHYGLTAAAYRYELKDICASDKFPMIIHWNFNHFVVLNGFIKSRAVITDPASGVVSVSMEEFNRSFTGIALAFDKSEQFTADGKPKSVINFLKVRLKGSFTSILFILILGLLAAIIGLMMPLFSKIFTDYILFGRSAEWLPTLLLTMLITMLVTFIIEALQSHYLLKIRGKLSAVSGAMFMWHVLRLPVDFFAQRFAGDICERQQSNDDVAEIICTQITPVVLSTIMIGIYMAVILYYDWLIASVGILAAILNIIVITVSTKKNENTSRTMLRDSGKISGITIAGIDMIETIKSSGAEAGYFEKWAGYQTKYNNSKKHIQVKSIYYGLLPQVLQNLLNIFVLIMGVYNILNGKFTVGALLSFQGFMGEFLQPVNQLVTLGQSIQDVRGQMERIEDVVNYSADTDVTFDDILSDEFESAKYSKLSGNIEIKHARFGYSTLGTPLFEDLNISIKKGQSIAIVGGSGSGKSTLAKLIAGLYKLRSGEILFDGKPKSMIDRNVFSGSVAVVDQAATVFNDTIKNNITMWNNQIDEKTVINACKDAQIHEDIVKRSGGYDNIILEGGRNLSGGQRQRIDIARALAVNPSIVLLDEATSALDPTTEKLIMDAIKVRGITSIIIAHRLSAIRDADKIIFLERGVIVEEGTHKELMELDGKYAKLVKSE